MSHTPLVLVHGNPETTAVWGPLLRHLDRADVFALSPPGFGAPLPAGFAATVDGYRDWLIAELEAVGRPVDLLGHDWGGAHVINVAMTRPDLLRTWASDAIGAFDPDYVWHDLAQRWVDPVHGERAVAERMGAPLAERVETLVARGMTDREVAAEVATGMGEEMARAVLSLYRDAVQPAMAERGRNLERAAARPGLCILATGDTFVGTPEQRRRSAARAGAQVVEIDGGHWWLVEAPAAGAEALGQFWASA